MFNLCIYDHGITVSADEIIPCIKVFIKDKLDKQLKIS